VQSFSATVLIARDSAGSIARVAAFVAVQNVLCNLVAIPLWGAGGAAGVALLSAFLLAVLNIRNAGRRTSGLDVARSFTGPLLAGAGMAFVGFALPLPAIPAGVLAVLVFYAALAAFELAFNRDDVRSYLRALPAAVRLRLGLLAT
jgi:O-antigen/teichoic acid export membrane protein